jgi:hypothetical protein
MPDTKAVPLSLTGRQVTQLRFDYAFGIELHDDSPGTSVRINVPFTLNNGIDSVSYDPEHGFECGPLLALLHKHVVSATAIEKGCLEIVFTDRLVVSVNPHPQFEAWEMVSSDGTRVISVPGGDLVTWSPDHLRPPTPLELQIFARLLSRPFPGSKEIAEQIRTASVRTIDKDGSLEIHSTSPAVANGVKARVPVEAEVEAEDGVCIHLLLHVVSGRVTELEIYKEDGSEIRALPEVDEMRVEIVS